MNSREIPRSRLMGGGLAALLLAPLAALYGADTPTPNIVYILADDIGYGNGLAELAFTREVNSDITPDGQLKPGAPKVQLYDLASDPMEQTNVTRQQPQVTRQLAELLHKYRQDGRTAPTR